MVVPLRRHYRGSARAQFPTTEWLRRIRLVEAATQGSIEGWKEANGECSISNLPKLGRSLPSFVAFIRCQSNLRDLDITFWAHILRTSVKGVVSRLGRSPFRP